MKKILTADRGLDIKASIDGHGVTHRYNFKSRNYKVNGWKPATPVIRKEH